MELSEDTFNRVPTYHNDPDAAYLLPNDSVEQARLIDQHNSISTLTKGIVHAPVSSPDTILDIGCGHGLVTRYLSSRFPAARHVYGVDLNDVPPRELDDKLSNLTFIRGNFRTIFKKDPRLSLGSMDFVYSRLLLCGMTDWAGYVRDIFGVLKPGGWVEISDYVEDVFYTDGRCTPHDDWEWLQSIRKGGELLGLDLDVGLTAKKYMEDAGFIDVQRLEFRIPYWRVPGADSEAMTELMLNDKWGLYWHMVPRLLAPLNLTDEKVAALRLDAIKDLGEEKGKEQLFCVTFGRKPAEAA